MVSKVVREDCENFELIAVLWIGSNQSYFVSITGVKLSGREQERIRWHQQYGEESEKHFISIQIPQEVEYYYSCAGLVDRHNPCRQKMFANEAFNYYKQLAHEPINNVFTHMGQHAASNTGKAIITQRGIQPGITLIPIIKKRKYE